MEDASKARVEMENECAHGVPLVPATTFSHIVLDIQYMYLFECAD